ncbi:HAD hydrolase-like protein [Acinetobacter defluvii]|uniref:HAD hydrolase-like protein n=1 Tax=Acinetobacter defluvii TaxID=1871111 RepID=UPI0009D668E7|nr:HAD hydrolase-like protein [Acinetobacter defluvii]
MFLETCQRFNISPHQALYIGDYLLNDYTGATNAGLNALLLNGFHEGVAYIPQRIDKLKHVVDYLD